MAENDQDKGPIKQPHKPQKPVQPPIPGKEGLDHEVAGQGVLGAQPESGKTETLRMVVAKATTTSMPRITIGTAHVLDPGHLVPKRRIETEAGAVAEADLLYRIGDDMVRNPPFSFMQTLYDSQAKRIIFGEDRVLQKVDKDKPPSPVAKPNTSSIPVRRDSLPRLCQASENLVALMSVNMEDGSKVGLADLERVEGLPETVQVSVIPAVDLIATQRINAEWAVDEVAQAYSIIFQHIEGDRDSQPGERSEASRTNVELSNAANLLAHQRIPQERRKGTPEETRKGENDVFADWVKADYPNPIICAPTLPPTIETQILEAGVAGLVFQHGGLGDHTCIFAQNTPTAMGVKELPNVRLRTGVSGVIIDEADGMVVFNPDEVTLGYYERKRQFYADQEERRLANRDKPAYTQDQNRVFIGANVDFANQAKSASNMGATVIGLARLEGKQFRILGSIPEEELRDMSLDEFCRVNEREMASHVSRVVENLGGRQVTFRDLDLGSRDKPGEVLKVLYPNLRYGHYQGGWDFLRDIPELHESALTGFLKAADRVNRTGKTNVRLMLPMAQNPDDFIEYRRRVEEVATSIGVSTPQIGIMVETPECIRNLRKFVDLAEFFSYGTNDLISHELAIPRTHPDFPVVHPGIIPLLIRSQAILGENDVTEVGMCGEWALNPVGACIASRLGIRELSGRAGLIPQAKDIIAGTNMVPWDKLGEDELLKRSCEASNQRELEDLWKAELPFLGELKSFHEQPPFEIPNS
ncbi:MAG: hypothetical protein GF416_01755 [Candidatus Altiarchaeales archaeon]|nr:hypothetical protein [Candidatus Altiarchaeales archaeon]MBD3415841.1 hypothetical protein [Candidatus Altiarchaeales archaeon]